MGANHTPNGLSAHRISRVVTHLDKPCPLLGRAYAHIRWEWGISQSRPPCFRALLFIALMSDKMNQFQLFPPPSPEVKRTNNPFRKGKKPVATSEPASSIPLEEIKDPGKTESLLLQIIEDTQSISPQPGDASRPKSPPVAGASHDSKSPESMHSQNRQAKKMNHEALPSHASQSSSSSSHHTTASTVSPQSSQSSATSVPMRSMFPQFDPKLPFSQQVYHPQLPDIPRPVKSSRKPPKLTLTTNTEIDNVLVCSISRLVPWSPRRSPTHLWRN
jgi:hypothetical protein